LEGSLLRAGQPYRHDGGDLPPQLRFELLGWDWMAIRSVGPQQASRLNQLLGVAEQALLERNEIGELTGVSAQSECHWIAVGRYP
jgi:hypothetical protein